MICFHLVGPPSRDLTYGQTISGRFDLSDSCPAVCPQIAFLHTYAKRVLNFILNSWNQERKADGHFILATSPFMLNVKLKVKLCGTFRYIVLPHWIRISWRLSLGLSSIRGNGFTMLLLLKVASRVVQIRLIMIRSLFCGWKVIGFSFLRLSTLFAV